MGEWVKTRLFGRIGRIGPIRPIHSLADSLILDHPGMGGGPATAKSPASSGTCPAAVQAAIPAFQTRESAVSWPLVTCDCSTSIAYGPFCWPLTATKNAIGCGTGGGPPAGIAPGWFCGPICCAIWLAIENPRPALNASLVPPAFSSEFAAWYFM